ncbi:hypothetical protein VIGAN_01250900 [Vigna angularis var. angularis]|uniref:Transmembrane protein n=1 Tax=Vigna angularis var. angularis TaxID=157739 RepID=A0A0S3R2B9_PHAAN|nr:hypothetical protein VIGAN_01250900 [Vigna angularis var. angularis]
MERLDVWKTEVEMDSRNVQERRENQKLSVSISFFLDQTLIFFHSSFLSSFFLFFSYSLFFQTVSSLFRSIIFLFFRALFLLNFTSGLTLLCFLNL